MADEEWLRFQAELAAVEQHVVTEEPQQGGPAAGSALPVAPPPTRPPPIAVAQAPPVVSKPPVTAMAAPQGPQFSAPPAASLAPPVPGLMANQGFQQQGMYGQPGMMQAAMGMGMGGMPMGMGMGGTGMGMQQQQQQQPAGGGGSAAAGGAAKPGGSKQQQGGKKKVLLREAGGQKWVDPTLNEWPDNDFRIFVGDIGNEVTDDLLAKSFSKYSSFAKAKVVRDPRTKKSKGYGFVSFLDGNDFAKALREMNGKYIGNRPCKLSKSSWDERTVRKVTLREPPAGNANKKQKR
ncbi:hypothetical protein VOLCADRAFT_72703 [Volvox carteri f. nagariensis]|uniref:RRM domain-containing protein n=1 Tax=Volvox carteri f. nagariensis TaxID=3068 RepID=D8TJ50_VOLCA|nr:uncharacterized protein VOLCADRAFT_72703 [Volvox carteri f. nagariensis]EFJ52313.1 hypothetical protein VOLCADRAFT_72703 [Volvox carteri f. nagariensis]|eukprot:XP_002946386.1 hypothetical protein VOLCADRAFT_72703 [Volvox carteri f. nagariensis]